MKIYNAVPGLGLLLFETHATFSGNKATLADQRLRGHKSIIDCALPCSLGSCRFNDVDPWNHIDNEKNVWQEFHFTLEAGINYNITLERDPTNCNVEPLRLLNGPSGFNAQEQFDYFHDECGPTERWAVTPLTTDAFKFSVTMSHDVEYQDAAQGCPSEGFKYSVVIEPPPISIDYIDPTCHEPPQQSFIVGSGTFESRPGSFRLDPTLTGEASFAFKINHNDGNANDQIVPTHSLSNSFMTQFNFDAANLHFTSTSYNWLFTNQRDGCARFQGTGSLDNDINAIFDVIAFEKGFEIYIYESFASGSRGSLIYHSFGRLNELLSGDIKVSNCKGTGVSFVGNTDDLDLAIPLCH
mmetsp:Transcript_44373/g.93195  ORF Transcript_44373/g.93195 Transcript_44373/m.93195 type:complete len:354 (-) Transcript_44373:359-1420(-)|eukprot:CAMPEP_0183705712 /NCGR_PEP_ID=MMETSP0737-20130205/2747_1 /TAXON_ID=385413 /ORGANISM="Thalassiosira miniscula, Strain CCMP1093" /LENGTH=353 /DNA_ID=CAMNT_0025932931 /DNA_START=36 /DNA_END=1097 /DNA_ORIENTATION=-